MRSSQSPSAVTMKIFIKQHQIAEIRIINKSPLLPMTGPLPLLVRQKYSRQPPANFVRHLSQRHHLSRPRRALHLQRLAIKKVIAFQRLDQQIIHWEPDWTAPVGIPAKKLA